jgi:hypothetical protein
VNGAVSYCERERDGAVFAHINGLVQGVAWGPAVDNGEWFVRFAGEKDAHRVSDKNAAVDELRQRFDRPERAS